MTLSPAEQDCGLAVREANHRFLNTLTAIGGLVRTDFGGFADPAVRDAVAVFSSRIQAFAGIHRTIDASAREPLVDAPTYLTRLCADLCAAHLAPRGVHCELHAEPGWLPRDVCQTLSLIIVELVTNAAKHAFTDRSSGRVSVTFRKGEQGWVCEVADNGGGMQGAHEGSGTGLVRSLAQMLDASLDVRSDQDGVAVTLAWPEVPVFAGGRLDDAA